MFASYKFTKSRAQIYTLHITAPSRANSTLSVQVDCTGIPNKPDTKKGEINVQ